MAGSLKETNYDEAKNVFEVIMKNFPTSSYFLKLYCELEKQEGHNSRVEAVGALLAIKCSFLTLI